MSETALDAPRAPAASIGVTLGDGGRLLDELAGLPVAARYAASFALVALATGLALAAEPQVAAPGLTLFFVVPVVLAASLFGWGPSLLAAVAGVLSFDFFFTEPKYSFEIARPADIWAAGLLLATAAIVSAVAAHARRRADDARREAMRAEALRALAHRVVEGRPSAEIIEVAATTLSLIFQAPAVVFAVHRGQFAPVAEAGGASVTAFDQEAAQEVSQSMFASRAEAYPFPNSAFDLWPVRPRTGPTLVLGVDFKHGREGRTSAPERFVELVAAYVASAHD